MKNKAAPTLVLTLQFVCVVMAFTIYTKVSFVSLRKSWSWPSAAHPLCFAPTLQYNLTQSLPLHN